MTLRITQSDIGKKFRDRDGVIAEIIHFRPGENLPVVFETPDGIEDTCQTNGCYWQSGKKSEHDLIARVDDEPQIIGAQNVLRALPITADDRKLHPVMTGAIDYFPLAVAAVARISRAGNDQHNPGQPLHWARGKSADHADCILRHLIERGTIDTDGMRHTAKAAWRILALLQEELEAEASWTPQLTTDN